MQRLQWIGITFSFGTNTGNHLHKLLQVCVDCDSTTCYGQGLADERAYLRGYHQLRIRVHTTCSNILRLRRVAVATYARRCVCAACYTTTALRDYCGKRARDLRLVGDLLRTRQGFYDGNIQFGAQRCTKYIQRNFVYCAWPQFVVG